jgi:hypothetical protein
MPTVSAVGTLPPATLGGLRPRVDAFDARLLTFRARAADQAHAASTPDTAWPGTRAPAKLIPRTQWPLGFDAIFLLFRRLNDDAPPGPPGRALLERLPGPHLTGSSPALSLDAHHDSRQLTQLQDGLAPTPAGPTPKGQRSSISHTAPLSRVTYMDPPSAFVTHHRVIAVVPLQNTGEPAPLLGDRVMHPSAHLGLDRFEPGVHLLLARDPLKLEPSVPVLRAQVREAQELERLRLAVAAALPGRVDLEGSLQALPRSPAP